MTFNSIGEVFNFKVYVFVGELGLNNNGMMWVATLPELRAAKRNQSVKCVQLTA